MTNEVNLITKDVIVVGGGMAGISAAISAAEKGAGFRTSCNNSNKKLAYCQQSL